MRNITKEGKIRKKKFTTKNKQWKTSIAYYKMSKMNLITKPLSNNNQMGLKVLDNNHSINKRTWECKETDCRHLKL